jgi:acyl-CoA thioesterase FadM
VAELRHRDTGEVFATNTNQVVTVSKETRQPTPLADWWKAKYASAVVEDKRLIVPMINVPDKTHVYQMKVPWSDIDGYKHTNYISYIQYCFEASMDAVVAGFYSKFKDDMLLYHVKEMEVAYKGETKAGDELQVATWENKEDPFKLHFDIRKAGSTVFQNSGIFYES